MNLNNNEFPTVESWLTEEFLDQVYELNVENKSKSEEYGKNSVGMVDFQSLPTTSLPKFDTTFWRHNPNPNPNGTRPQDLMLATGWNEHTSATTFTFQPQDLTNAGVTSMSNNFEPFAAINAVNNYKNFDGNEIESNQQQFYESQTEQNCINQNLDDAEEVPSTKDYDIKCYNCDVCFEKSAFQTHVCEYDEYHRPISNIIANTTPSVTQAPVQDLVSVFTGEPDCIRMVRDNQTRVRRFLREEVKCDLDAKDYRKKISNTSNSKEDSRLECPQCKRTFVRFCSFSRHLDAHAMDLIPTPNLAPRDSKERGMQAKRTVQASTKLRVVIKCVLCGRVFFDPENASVHLGVHFPDDAQQELDNYVEIPYENHVRKAIEFLAKKDKDTLEEQADYLQPAEEIKPAHLKVIIVNCLLQCEFCDFVFSNVGCLLVHSACHSPERPFECTACGIRLRTSKESTIHSQVECVFMRENIKVYRASLQRHFVCNVCEQKFPTMPQLHYHRYSEYHFFPRFNKNVGRLQLPCEQCDAIFATAAECIAHYQTKHRKKGRSSVPPGTRQYLCDICGKTYTQSSHLTLHKRFHEGLKPFSCREPDCTRKFTIRADLNDHMRKVHTGERPYQCLECGKSFLTGSVFYQHRLIHRGERRHECEECHKRFYRADGLKNHLRIHTGEKPFSCIYCIKNFRQRGDRDKHMRARHALLNEKSRLLMQMEKLQLEKVPEAKPYEQEQSLFTCETSTSDNMPILNLQDLLSEMDVDVDVDQRATDLITKNGEFPQSVVNALNGIDANVSRR